MARASRPSVVVVKSARKGIRALPPHVRRACKLVLDRIVAGILSGERLKGELAELRYVRLGRSHRLLYRQSGNEIQVVDVAPRRLVPG